MAKQPKPIETVITNYTGVSFKAKVNQYYRGKKVETVFIDIVPLSHSYSLPWMDKAVKIINPVVPNAMKSDDMISFGDEIRMCDADEEGE